MSDFKMRHMNRFKFFKKIACLIIGLPFLVEAQITLPGFGGRTFGTETISSQEPVIIGVTTISANDTLTITSGGAVLCSGTIEIESGAKIVIESGGLLQVGNVVTFEAAADFIQIDVQPGGKLLVDNTFTTMHFDDNDGNIQFAVEGQSSGSSLIGSPVSDATYTGSEFIYNEVSTSGYGTWDLASASAPITPGTGYAASSPGTVTFIGTPNTQPISVSGTVSNSGTRGNQSSHFLVANPYTSTMDVLSFLTRNITNTFGTVYVWDATSGAYIVSNGTLGQLEELAAGQAFFVQFDYPSLGDGIYSIDFHPDDLNTDNAQFYRKASTSGKIELNFGAGTDTTNYTAILVGNDFTGAYDKLGDAYSFSTQDESLLKPYISYDEKAYEFIALPYDLAYSIPVHFNLAEDQEVTISVLNVEDIDPEYSVKVTNTLTGESEVLHPDSEISFSMPAMHSEAIKIQVQLPLNVEEVDRSPILYVREDRLFLKDIDDLEPDATVSLHSLNGQHIKSWKIKDGRIGYPINDLSGIFIATMENGQIIHTQKIIINN